MARDTVTTLWKTALDIASALPCAATPAQSSLHDAEAAKCAFEQAHQLHFVGPTSIFDASTPGQL